MNVVSIIMLVFALLGAIDRIFGSKLGLGKEFEKGFLLLGQVVLSMLGMIILAPVLADLLSPVFDFVYKVFKMEPSIIPAMLFANDMGGAPLAKEIAKNSQLGMYNAMVVSAMMGATISFTIPVALGCIKKEKQKELILGLLCGIVTIPIGCLVSGFICNIPFLPLVLNLLPLIVFAVVMALGLLFLPKVCIKIFGVVGVVIKIMITVGLALGIIEVLSGVKLLERTAAVTEGVMICFNAVVVMSGAFPLLTILSKVLSRPMKKLGGLLGINEKSTLGFISTLATNMPTFGIMNEMDRKGTVLNSAFAVSAAFVLAGHLAFTLAFAPEYLLSVMVGKIVAGITAVIFAIIIYKKVGHTLDTEKNADA